MFKSRLHEVTVALFDRVIKENSPILLANTKRPFWYLRPFWKRSANKAFNRLMNEYFMVFGAPTNLVAYLEAMREYADLYERVLNGERHLKTNARRAYNRAQEYLKSDGETKDLFYTCGVISKTLGFRINPEEVSLKEFYNLLELLKDHGRKEA